MQSMPGEIFKGKVSYLYPVLNDTSRTLQIRIELPNKENRLRPGMYANVKFTGQTYEALSIPTDSIIATGQRTVVIVKEDNGYRPVEIKTGNEGNEFTEVLEGLNEDEQIVVSGQFLIDSEASLSGVLARLSQRTKSVVMDKNSRDKSLEKTPSENMPKGHGKVVNVDPKSNHITLNHDQIPEIGWPSMTMGFKVKDSNQLIQLKVGDEVNFALKAEASANRDMPAQYMIERIEKMDVMKSNMKGAKP